MQGEKFHPDVRGVVQMFNFVSRPETEPGSAGEQPCDGYVSDAYAWTGRSLSRLRLKLLNQPKCLVLLMFTSFLSIGPKKARHFFASSEFSRILDYLSSQINEQSPR